MELSAAASEKIASLLASNGLLTKDRLTKITTQCGPNKGKIVDELLKKNFTTEEDIAKVISRNFSIKQVTVNIDSIKPDIAKILPLEFIIKEKVIPYAVEAGVLKLLIADPSKLIHAAKIKNFTKKNVLFTVSTFSNVDELAANRMWEMAEKKNTTPQQQIQKKKAQTYTK